MKPALLLIIALTCAACATASPLAGETEATTPSEPNELAETAWVLLSYGSPDAEIAVVDGSLITLEFGAEGQVVGSSICNTYAAQYDVQDDTLAFANVTSTRVACADETALQQEADYLQALKSAGAFEVAKNRLMISYNAGTAMLTFLRL